MHVIPLLSAHTQVGYAHLRDRYVLPALGRHRLTEITPRVVNRFRADLLAAGVGAPTVRKTLAVLQSMLAIAVEEERVGSNPVAKVRKPSQLPQRRVEPLSPRQVEALRSSLSVADAMLVSVLAYAGLRPGEALALRWRCVGARTITVDRAIAFGQEKPTKTNRTRHVRMLTPLADDLEDWRSIRRSPPATALVFGREDGSPWRDDDWRNWRRRVFVPAARAAGVRHCRPYDLRASFVSLLIREGQTVMEVARQAGHSPETCLRHYAGVFSDYDPADRAGAEDEIRRARLSLGRQADAA